MTGGFLEAVPLRPLVLRPPPPTPPLRRASLAPACHYPAALRWNGHKARSRVCQRGGNGGGGDDRWRCRCSRRVGSYPLKALRCASRCFAVLRFPRIVCGCEGSPPLSFWSRSIQLGLQQLNSSMVSSSSPAPLPRHPAAGSHGGGAERGFESCPFTHRPWALRRSLCSRRAATSRHRYHASCVLSAAQTTTESPGAVVG